MQQVLLVIAPICAWWAYRNEYPGVRLEALAPYVARRVSQLQASDYLPQHAYKIDYHHPITIHVRQMLRAAKVLSLIRARAILSSPLPVGICIFGDPLHDKTSLAWVAMRTVLPGWSCVQWPHRSRHPEGIETMVGGRVVLWLDDLHEYANRVEAAQLEFLLDRFAQRGVLVVVVATCNWHDDEHEARARLGNLFDLLLPIRLPEQSSGIIDTDLERDLAEKRHDYASLLEGVMNRHRRVRRIGE